MQTIAREPRQPTLLRTHALSFNNSRQCRTDIARYLWNKMERPLTLWSDGFVHIPEQFNCFYSVQKHTNKEKWCYDNWISVDKELTWDSYLITYQKN